MLKNPKEAALLKKPHKYKAQPITIDGIRFHASCEAIIICLKLL